MKLHEIKDIYDVFPDALTEAAFNTRFDTLSWSKRGANYVGTGVIDADEFSLAIEPLIFDVNGKKHLCLNLGFARMVNGEPLETLISTGRDQSRAFGALKNAFEGKLEELEAELLIDAICLIARKGEEKRLSFYTRLISSKMHGFRRFQQRRFQTEIAGGTAMVGMSRDLTKEENAALKDALQKNGKPFIEF